MSSILAIGGLFAAASLAGDGLANFLGLETLRHGTGFGGLVGIHLMEGGDPEKAGSGSNEGNFTLGREDAIRNFYVVKDSEYRLDKTESRRDYWIHRVPIISSAGRAIDKRCKTLFHTFLALVGEAEAVASKMHSENFRPFVNNLITTVSVMTSVILTPIMPIVKVHVTPDQVRELGFKNDPEYHGLAYMTDQKIASSNMGLIGTLKNGFNAGFFRRTYETPGKVLTGIMQMTAAFALSFFMLNNQASQVAQRESASSDSTRLIIGGLIVGLCALAVKVNSIICEIKNPISNQRPRRRKYRIPENLPIQTADLPSGAAQSLRVRHSRAMLAAARGDKS